MIEPVIQMKPPRSAYANRLDEFREIAFANDRVCVHRGQWREFFAPRIGASFDGRIVFEIGCADGDFLARIASKNPRTAFVGLDWKCKAIHDAAARATSDALANVAFIRARAQDISQLFDNGEVNEIWIFHPEPCEREVELKNRLINETFLSNAFKVMGAGSMRLCLKTDHVEYYDHVMETISLPTIRSLFDVVVSSRDLWADADTQRRIGARLFAAEKTGYEQRFVRRRKPIHYLELQPNEPAD